VLRDWTVELELVRSKKKGKEFEMSLFGERNLLQLVLAKLSHSDSCLLVHANSFLNETGKGTTYLCFICLKLIVQKNSSVKPQLLMLPLISALDATVNFLLLL
jgi:hypothetical protein